MKRVLITGASGRLARHLIPILLEHGYQVRGLIHNTPLTAPWASDVEQVSGGLEVRKVLDESVRDVDVVCHLAALMPPAADDVLFEANIRGTYHLLQAVAACPVKPRFVFASSDATYCTGWSFTPYPSPIDENTTLRPALFYGVTKVLGEQMCVHYQDIYEIPTVRLRFDWILEPSEVLDIFLSAPYSDQLIPHDKGRWDDPNTVKIPLEADGAPFLEHIGDVRDSAQGAFLAIEKEAAPGHVFNIAGPAAFTYTEIGPIVAKRLGVEAISGRCIGLYSYEISNQKAQAMLDYRPAYAVLDSLEGALSQKAAAFRRSSQG